MEKDSKIYIAGHLGLVGSAIYRCLQAEGFTNLVTRTRAELDLERQADVEAFFEAERPEYVYLAAAKVGGIWANATYPGDFVYNNLAIQTNVIHAAWKTGGKRLLFLGSSCIYPRECPQPMREEFLLTGPLEPTNQPYAVAKIGGIIQCAAYNRQYGTRFLAVMPTNLYGPNDNFDLESSHVLPALIRKFHLAKLAAQGDWEAITCDEKRFGPIPEDIMANLMAISQAHGRNTPPSLTVSALSLNPLAHNPGVTLWGSGSPRRELLHVDDLANACLFLMTRDDRTFRNLCLGSLSQGSAPRGPHSTLDDSSAPSTRNRLPLINIGYSKDLTIKELATLVARLVGYEGEILWDDSKPDGNPRKLLAASRLMMLGWSPKIDLETGIESTYQWYISQTKA